MVFIWEFEFFEEDNGFCAIPCGDFGYGATCGDDLVDAVESAVDFLSIAVDDHLINGVVLPPMEFGHKPEHDGRIIAVAVDRSIEDIPAMTAAEAARKLGVSRARITQLCNAGVLESWMSGSNRMVSKGSVDAQIEKRIQKQVERQFGGDLDWYDCSEIARALHLAGIDDIDEAGRTKVDAVVQATLAEL